MTDKYISVADYCQVLIQVQVTDTYVSVTGWQL